MTYKKTIVWDCGNGASGPLVEMLITKLPGKHVVLYSKVDGNFPNHHPDPTDETTLKILIKKMKEVDALEYMIELKNKCKKVGGNFVLLWHNSYFKKK